MELSSADLVEVAKARGIRISARQIERWRYEGLLPRATRKGLGHARGTRWVYSDGVTARFLSVVDLVVVRRMPIAEAAVQYASTASM